MDAEGAAPGTQFTAFTTNTGSPVGMSDGAAGRIFAVAEPASVGGLERTGSDSSIDPVDPAAVHTNHGANDGFQDRRAGGRSRCAEVR